jgi:hypothetical protein
MSPKVKQFFLVVIVVFVSACGATFLVNVTDIFNTPPSTWETIVNSGVIAVVSYIVAWLVPQVKSFGIGSE